MPTAEEIKNFLRSLGLLHGVPPKGWNEVVYIKPIHFLNIVLLVATTIDHKTGEVRDKGTDAFRYQLWTMDLRRLIHHEGSTRRSQNWRTWMKKKIEDLTLKAPGIMRNKNI